MILISNQVIGALENNTQYLSSILHNEHVAASRLTLALCAKLFAAAKGLAKTGYTNSAALKSTAH